MSTYAPFQLPCLAQGLPSYMDTVNNEHTSALEWLLLRQARWDVMSWERGSRMAKPSLPTLSG